MTYFPRCTVTGEGLCGKLRQQSFDLLIRQVVILPSRSQRVAIHSLSRLRVETRVKAQGSLRVRFTLLQVWQLSQTKECLSMHSSGRGSLKSRANENRLQIPEGQKAGSLVNIPKAKSKKDNLRFDPQPNTCGFSWAPQYPIWRVKIFWLSCWVVHVVLVLKDFHPPGPHSQDQWVGFAIKNELCMLYTLCNYKYIFLPPCQDRL